MKALLNGWNGSILGQIDFWNDLEIEQSQQWVRPSFSKTLT